MAADDKESDERHHSRSLERDRGKRHRRHRSSSPSPPKQRCKRSCSPGAKEKHRHKNSAEKHEDRKRHKVSNKNAESMSEEDNSREVARKTDEKAGVRKSSKEDRKVELHSSGNSSGDAYSDNESDKGRKKKSRSKSPKSQKSKSEHQQHVRSELEQDESQTEGTSEESSEDSEDECRRAKRPKRLKQKKRVERERREERKQKKEKKQKMKEKERKLEKRKKEKVEKRAKGPISDDLGDHLEGNNMHGIDGSCDDPILRPQHKIFLSHSGAQKEFVEHLCKAFEDWCHYPFFDRSHESLPKGEKFPELIVQAAQQCEMLIVVVSKEYFMSKWPMIELSAFVKAHELNHGSYHGPKILPLFYGLSMSDLDNEGMQRKWFQKWKILAKVDPKKRIIESDWKDAFNALRSFNGLSYDRNLKEVVAYEEEIVSHVCKSIAPDIKWDDSHVQGKSSICKVIGAKIEGLGISQKYKVKVVGIYGVGGIGKTTTCKTLCNEFSSKYEGRVCHIEFPSVPSSDSKQLFQKVVRDLTRKSVENIQHLDEGQCKDILRNNLFKQRTFLAIDNISDNHQSIQHAKSFLELPYHMESLVVVTARSQGALELLGLDGVACLEMPDLEEVDAVNLFLHHAIGGQKTFEDEEMYDIMTCIGRCYFSKGDGRSHHYHPLALQSLGLQLGCYGEHPSLWVKHLPCMRDSNLLSGEDPVFSILRSSFDLLPPRDQALFMDVGCFCRSMYFFESFRHRESLLYAQKKEEERMAYIAWLCCAHKQDGEGLALQLERLKRRGLLQDVDLKSGRISMHDLYWEFANLEAMGSFNESTNLSEQMWVYVDDGDLTELECNPKGGCWPKLRRVRIMQPPYNIKDHTRILHRFRSITEHIKWDHFPNVEVLQLIDLHWGHGALNLEGLVHLRILELHTVDAIGRIEGLETLKHLTYFEWINLTSTLSPSRNVHIVERLPSSLQYLNISHPDEVIGSSQFLRFHKLSKLVLHRVEARSLDLSNCWTLEIVHLYNIRNLQRVLGLGAKHPSILQSLEVISCEDLIDILRIDQLINLKKLNIQSSPKYEVPSLLTCTELQELTISSQPRLMLSAQDHLPCQLQKLFLLPNAYNEGLNLSGFNQLEVLQIVSQQLKSLAELGDLDLGNCQYLLRLPNLSVSRNLKSLFIGRCSSLELHENDIQMLSELPLLQPINFSRFGVSKLKLDLTRRKVFIKLSKWWEEDQWTEQDLGALPITIGRWISSFEGTSTSGNKVLMP